MEPYRRILLPTDFSPASRQGVARGAELAHHDGAEWLLLSVVRKSFSAPLAMVHQAPVTFGGEGDLLGETVEDGEKRLKALAEELFAGVGARRRSSSRRAPPAASSTRPRSS